MNVIDFLKTLPHVEPDVDYLNAPDYYPFLNSLARDFKATRVLEIGVRFGYSAVAFIYGNPVKEYVGIDYDLYDAASSTKSRTNLKYLNDTQPVNFTLFKENTQALTDLSFLGSEPFDFIHIDGDHSYEGALTDLKNFWNVLTMVGHMLVDDSIFYGSVNTACTDFARLIDEPCYNVKSFRGTWVFLKTRERNFPISKSTINEMTPKTPINATDIFKQFDAQHVGWCGRVVLFKDGSFKGGLNSPDGRWRIEGDLLTLGWYHWPESVLNSDGEGSYFSLEPGLFALHEIADEENNQHLGGNIHGGDPMTFYPELWKWLGERFSIASVLDIGCGEGHALVEFHRLGIRAVGIDGYKPNVIETRQRGLPCILHDFTKGDPFINEDFDLGWSCEFVEHVEEQFLRNILAAFRKCRLVAMTHARPGQGGYHHVNCQPSEYWVQKMANAGFTLLSRESEESRKFYPNTYWGWTGLIFKRNNTRSQVTPCEASNSDHFRAPTIEVAGWMSSTLPLWSYFFPENPYSRFDPNPYPHDVQGWGSDDPVFASLISYVQPKLIVEVGSWKGLSAINMAKLCRERDLPAQILCVDTWLGTIESYSWRDREKSLYESLHFRYGRPNLYYQFLANVMRAGVNDMITPLPQTSEIGARLLSHFGIVPDLVYIDASHDYFDVLRDLTNYFSLMRSGGVLFGDDYLGWEGVTRAVKEFCARINHPLWGRFGKYVIVKEGDARTIPGLIQG